MKAMARRVTAVVGAMGLAVGVGCGHDHPAVDAGLACTDPAQISLPSCTAGPDLFSDEACTTLDDAIGRAQADDARAPSVTAPTEGQAVSEAAGFVFRWEAPTAAVVPWGPRGNRGRRAFSWRDDLVRWSVLVPEAQAHCAPFTGRAYELRFRVGGAVVLRRQQSATNYTPGPDAWARLRAAAGSNPVELVIATAVFNQNAITAGNGPFVTATPRRFTLAP